MEWNFSGSQIVLPRNAEFGVPQWQFGLSTYAFSSEDTLIYACTVNGEWRIGRLNVRSLDAMDYPFSFSYVYPPSPVKAG